jgi:hypothetical protein
MEGDGEEQMKSNSCQTKATNFYLSALCNLLHLLQPWDLSSKGRGKKSSGAQFRLEK